MKIWTNVKYDDATLALLRAETGGHELTFAPADAFAVEADILYGQPPLEVIERAAKLRWLHVDTAGYERYDNDALRADLQQRSIAFTNSSSVFAEPCAQHLLALMLGLARCIPQSVTNQDGARDWPMMPLRAETILLNGQTAVLLGYGAIARRLVELLTPFEMRLVALRRQARGDESIPVISERELPTALAQADHVINILPGGPATRQFVNADVLDALKPGARFYNIGRGGTVDQDALLSALQRGTLGAAYLDVTDPEPLPPEHALWRAPNCFITPHTGGGHHNERERQARHFLTNLQRFVAGEALLDRVV